MALSVLFFSSFLRGSGNLFLLLLNFVWLGAVHGFGFKSNSPDFF